jgi:membrane-associated protease RseP (regulator of RpoE activity)
MEDPKMNRSWTIAAASAAAGAAALSLGLFLAVGKESLADAGDKDKTVRIVTVPGDDAEAIAAYEADEEGRWGKGGYLGLSLREDTKSSEGGALVKNVVDDSPAAKAGIKDGDVIVGFGGDIVRGPLRVTEKLRAAKPGDKVTLDVRRDGKTQKMSVELGERPTMAWSYRSGDGAPLSEEAQKDLEKSLKSLETLPELGTRIGKMKFYTPGRHGMMLFGRNKPLLGVEMIDTTPELREAMGGTKDAGVLVGKVLPGTAAEKCGLRVGDLILSVDGDKVADPGDLGEAIGKHEGKTVDLDVVRDKKTIHVKAVLPKIDEPEDEPTGPRASVWRVPGIAPLAPAPALAPRVPPRPIAAPVPPAPPVPPVPPCAAAQFV